MIPAKIHQDRNPLRDAQLARLFEALGQIGAEQIDLASFLRLFQAMASKIQVPFNQGWISQGVVSLEPRAVTIASGAIQLLGSNLVVDTESAAATDNLDNLNGGEDGDLVILSSTDAARTVVVRHNAPGNLRLNASANFSLDNPADRLILLRKGGLWGECGRGNNS